MKDNSPNVTFVHSEPQGPQHCLYEELLWDAVVRVPCGCVNMHVSTNEEYKL